MQPNTGMGVTQFNGVNPLAMISIGGTDWRLRRDATDPTNVFPHQRVTWINAGCEPLPDGRAHFCWVMGVIPPAPGTLERAISVMYVGFHPIKIMVMPNTVTHEDLDRMHVYVSDGANFAGEFVNRFLGMSAPAVTARETISPWPIAPAAEVRKEAAPVRKVETAAPAREVVKDDE